MVVPCPIISNWEDLQLWIESLLRCCASVKCGEVPCQSGNRSYVMWSYCALNIEINNLLGFDLRVVCLPAELSEVVPAL